MTKTQKKKTGARSMGCSSGLRLSTEQCKCSVSHTRLSGTSNKYT